MIEELELLQRIKRDLLMRAELDEDSVSVVNLGNSIWLSLKERIKYLESVDDLTEIKLQNGISDLTSTKTRLIKRYSALCDNINVIDKNTFYNDNWRGTGKRKKGKTN